VLLYPFAQHVAFYLAQVDGMVEQSDLVRAVLELPVQDVAPQLFGRARELIDRHHVVEVLVW
tara:strand:+ start:416 stop:601 length:186 start_codon:yes stop_codon:yes gene_type:complete